MNTTGINGIDSLQGLAYWTNTQVSGLLFTGGLIALFIVAVMVLLRNDENILNALTITGWTFFILSLFFWISELVAVVLPILFLSISLVGTILLYSGKN